MDVDDESMPVWILAFWKQLWERAEGRGAHNEIKPLPIFKGLMENSRNYHDAACILRSVRCLGAREPDPDAPNFQESCELVRKTRVTCDPAGILHPREKLLEYIGDNPLPPRVGISEQTQQSRIKSRAQEAFDPSLDAWDELMNSSNEGDGGI